MATKIQNCSGPQIPLRGPGQHHQKRVDWKRFELNGTKKEDIYFYSTYETTVEFSNKVRKHASYVLEKDFVVWRVEIQP